MRWFSTRIGGGASSPSATFSATVSDSNSAKCCITMPMPSARAADGLAICTGWPSQRISPASAFSNPKTIFTRVDLPAPFSPSSA